MTINPNENSNGNKRTDRIEHREGMSAVERGRCARPGIPPSGTFG